MAVEKYRREDSELSIASISRFLQDFDYSKSCGPGVVGSDAYHAIACDLAARLVELSREERRRYLAKNFIGFLPPEIRKCFDRDSMTIDSIRQKERERPASGVNNVWYSRGDNLVLVFVHGVLSSSRTCWWAQSGSYWPELIVKDQDLKGVGVFLGGYYSGIGAGGYNLSDSANEMYDALIRPGVGGGDAVLDKKNVVFVCHSLGGAVVRQMLLKRSQEVSLNSDGTHKNVGVVLLASPSTGSAYADVLRLVIKRYGHAQGESLQKDNVLLEGLDSDFRDMVSNGAIPGLCGQEAIENHLLKSMKWLPFWKRKQIVKYDSASRYFPGSRRLPGTDHFSIAKPEDANHPSHLFLKDFLRQKGFLNAE